MRSKPTRTGAPDAHESAALMRAKSSQSITTSTPCRRKARTVCQVVDKNVRKSRSLSV